MAKLVTIYRKKDNIKEKQRHLIQFKVTYGNNTFTLKSDGITKIFKGTKEEFAKFLKNIQAKDNYSEPKSARKLTYMQITDEIITGNDPIIYVWSNNLKGYDKIIIG